MNAKSVVNPLCLKLNRIASRKTQKALAREINRSQPWYSRLENAKPGSVVTGHDLVELAAALGVNVSDLEVKQ